MVYKPPSYDNTQFLQHLENIMTKYTNKHIIIGDVNINLLGNDTNLINRYKNVIYQNNFTISNTINMESATRITPNCKSIIDHVLTNIKNKQHCTINIDENPLSDHKKILITIAEEVELYKPKTTYEVKGTNYNRFKNIFANQVVVNNVDSFQHLIATIQQCKAQCEYTKVLKCRENNMWITDELLNLMNERDKLYKKMCQKADEISESKFKILKNKINNKIKVLKNNHFKNRWEQTGSDTKKQWRFINHFFSNKNTKTCIDRLECENSIISNPVDIVNALNRHFSQVGKTIVNNINKELNDLDQDLQNYINEFQEITCENTLFLAPTDDGELGKVIADLKVNSAPGHDQVTVQDVRNLSDTIIPILVILINQVLFTSNFPNELKITKISPIFKAGSKQDRNNYRPISVVSVFSKIIEKIIEIRMVAFIKKYIKTDPFQYGFIKDSSTLSAIIDLVDNISTELDNHKIVIAVFVDLRKAFDVVSPVILLNKLRYMGFRGPILNLLRTFLTNRKQYVRLDNYSSETEISECGVPQGSVLGPLLYSLYVLNLKIAGLEAQYYTFADDTVLIYSSEKINDLEYKVNTDLKLYTSWLLHNKLRINIEKTKFLLFKQKSKMIANPHIIINNKEIEQVKKIKYLGLIIDHNLDWKEHINCLNNKISSIISAMFRLRDYVSKRTKMSVYNAFCLSHFRYLIPVWGTCGVTIFNNIQVLQNKILKILFNYNWLTHTDQLYEELGMLDLRRLMEFEQCKLVYRILNNRQKTNVNILINNNVHIYNTRTCDRIHLNNINTNKGLCNPISQSSTVYNNLPVNIKKTAAN